mgnify:CR=1 FL=1
MTNETKQMILENHNGFAYRLLSRMCMDCDYFLNAGGRHEKFLWSGNVNEHIADMKFIYNNLKEKPEWLAMKQIETWEHEMKA